jgi:outer membrane biosynthesis protein TonB
MGRPNQTHERLDALLDGRPGEVVDDLAPLLAAAEALRGELAEFELDPEVVDRHLEQVLDRPAAVVPLPVREDRGGGLRRRLVAVGLAAALVLVPATAASAASGSALPGQPLYPVKLAFEQFRLATVQWSATAEAQERARLAAKRLAELDKLVQLRMYGQVPHAIRALDKAVAAAESAVAEAAAKDGADPKLVTVLNKLNDVAVAQHGELVALNKLAAVLPGSITQAVTQSPALPTPNLPAVPPVLQPAVTTPLPSPQPPPVTSPPTTNPPQPPPAAVPTTQPEPPPAPTTEPPPPPSTEPPPVTEPTTTTPPTTAASQDQGSPSGVESEGTPATSGP